MTNVLNAAAAIILFAAFALPFACIAIVAYECWQFGACVAFMILLCWAAIRAEDIIAEDRNR